MGWWSVLVWMVVLLGCQRAQMQQSYNRGDTPAATSPSAAVTPAPQRADTPVITHIAVLRTSLGEITLGLYGEDAPKTVRNFVELSRRGYYDGVLFHRVARNFVIQAGDPLTKDPKQRARWGTGGTSIYGGEFEDELNPETPSYRLGYQLGTVAMANRGPNTNTSQFFICLERAVNLPKAYTIFGRVLEGMDVVRKIAAVPIDPGPFGPEDGTPKTPVVIESVQVREVRKGQ
ncbi:MAG: peptidylprolyl isomerase [Candidatus Kapabacteria bacterium]|nr:peptidylprolyl isomerase [Candidatus Kapabacteria bacterium]MDW8012998.1 peptidylprolyl isomerase [Bacteroidota bacterium]